MKKVLIFLVILSVVLPHSAFASEQDTVPPSKWKQYWKFSGTVGLKVSQVQLINWAAGGNSTFSGISYANLTLNYKKSKLAWDTNLNTDLGVLYSSGFNTYKWRKGNDNIVFNTTLGYEISSPKHAKSTWYVAAKGAFRSQYTRGYDFPDDGSRVKVSNWLSPSYTELSMGVNWKWTELITLFYSPVAALVTSCTDSVLRPSHSIPLNQTAVASLGMAFRAGIMYDGVKNLKILTGLALYTPYNDPAQKFGSFNVDWDVMITYQFLKVLSASLTTNLKYYPKVYFAEEPHRRVQFQEILGLGIAYSF